METIHLKDYKIIRAIGEGGMATVYLAEHLKFKKPVAIKVLNREYALNSNIRSRFISEARNMFSMSHPNITRVIDLIEDGDTIGFVMEYIDGITLKEMLEKNPSIDSNTLKNIFSQILDALDYVHQSKLVHRDVKPSNFMVTKSGQVKLLDFGIAKMNDWENKDYTVTSTNQSMGTPMYMSPEQVTSTKSVSSLSDVYSLGVILWEMITGKKPYEANTLSTFQLQTKIVNDPLVLTGTRFDEIIQKATAKQQEARFQGTEEFKVRFLALFKNTIDSDKTMILESQLRDVPVPSPRKGRKQKTAVWAVPLVLLIAAFSVFLMTRKSGQRDSNRKPETSTTATDVKSAPIPETNIEETSPEKIQQETTVMHSYLDANGKLVYQSPCLMIVTGAYLYEKDAKNYVTRERLSGTNNAGYLWIPDYPSLSGKMNYATFWGPYYSAEDCNEQLRTLPDNRKFYYAKLVSMANINQIEIKYSANDPLGDRLKSLLNNPQEKMK